MDSPENLREQVRSALQLRVSREQLLRYSTGAILSAATATESFVEGPKALLIAKGLIEQAFGIYRRRRSLNSARDDDRGSVETVEAVELPEAAVSPEQEPQAEPYEFMLDEFNPQQKDQMIIHIENQVKYYIAHGALGERLTNARESAAILEEMLSPKLREKLGLSDEVIKAFEGLMFIETEDGGKTTSIAGAVGPSQITDLAALDGAEFLELQGIDPNELDPQAIEQIDYVSLHNLDDLTKLTKKQQIALGLAYYLRLLRAYEKENQGKINYGFTGMAYNAGKANVDRAKEGLGIINNTLEFYTSNTAVARLPAALRTEEARYFFVKQAAGVKILAEY